MIDRSSRHRARASVARLVQRLTAPTAITVAAGVATQVLLVVTGVLTARALGPEDRGYLALFFLAPILLWQIGGLGVPSAITFFVASQPRLRVDLKLLSLRMLAVQAPALVAIQTALSVWLLPSHEPRLRTALGVALILAPAYLLHQYACAFLQGERRFWPFNLLRLMPMVCFTAGVVTLAVTGQLNLVSATTAFTGSVVISASVAALFVYRGGLAIRRGVEPGLHWRVLRFGLKAIFGYASPVENYRLDQAVAAFILPPVSLGIYVVALSFTNMPRFVAQGVGMVLFPKVAAIRDFDRAWNAMWRFFGRTVALYALIVPLIWLTAPVLVPAFFGEGFAEAVPVLRLVLIAVLFQCVRRVLVDGSRGLGWPGIGTVVELTSLGTALPLALAFGLAGGLQGVAAGLAVSSFLVTALLIGWLLRARARTRRAGVGMSEPVLRPSPSHRHGDVTAAWSS